MAQPRLEWREAARADLLAIVDYISDDNVDAALSLLEDIEAKAAQLVDNPKLYQAGRIKGTREMLERRAESMNRGFRFASDCDSTSLEVDHGQMSI